MTRRHAASLLLALIGAVTLTLSRPVAATRAPQQVQVVTGPEIWRGVSRVNCRLTTSATSSTAVTGCSAPGAGLAIYVTDLSVYGGVATGATASAAVQYGTGGTCGSGTTVVYDCQHGTTSGCEAHLTTPIRIATNSEVCLLDATVGTKFVSINGYVAP